MSTTTAQLEISSMPSPMASRVVDTLLTTYRQSTHRANSERIGKNDTLVEFVPTEVLSQIKNVADLHCEKVVRAYFGRYPDDFVDSNLAGRQTIVYTFEALKYSPKRVIVPDNIIVFNSNGRIDNTLAGTLLSSYRRTSHPANSERIGKIDSASVFLSILISDEMHEAITRCGAAGVNLYFGRYPDDNGVIEMHERHVDVAGRQTLVVILGELLQLNDCFVVPEDVHAFFDYPVCPPFCNCIPKPGHPC